MTQSEYCIKSKQHSSNHDIDFDMDDDDDLDDDEYDEEYSSSGKCQKYHCNVRGDIIFAAIKHLKELISDSYACRLIYGPPDFIYEIYDHVTSNCSILVQFEQLKVDQNPTSKS